MAHTLNGYKIIVFEDSDDPYLPKVSILEVIGATSSVKHYSGKSSPTRKIRGYMDWVGGGCSAGDYDNLCASLGSSAVTYVAHDGSQGSYVVTRINAERVFNINQDEPIYRVTVDMVKD